MTQATLGAVDHRMSPVPATGSVKELRALAALTTSFVATDVVNVEGIRRVALWISYDGDGAATLAGQAQILPLISAEKTAPAVGDDSWYGMAALDLTPTDTVLTPAVPSGADYTLQPEWGVLQTRPIAINTLPTDANTDKIRQCVVLDVTHARWLYLACAEIGDTDGDEGSLGIKWSVAL